jgi:signal transduction histidine kinase
LRTPLTAILGFSRTLERDDVDLSREDQQDLAERITRNAHKLDRLLSDLLNLERLDRGLVEPNRSPTDVGALVRSVIKESDIGEHPLHVNADPVVASVDRAQVERIVENLLVNAVRHTNPRTEIWIRVREEPDGVLIAVEDAGSGVPVDARATVFEPFGRTGAASETPGIGIGLSLVSRFAELHGGRAWVDDRVGGGASFRVFLPNSVGKTRFT